MKTQFDYPTTRTIQPKILYFGTPVVLITSLNEDGSSNLAPLSSAWALGWRIVIGLGTDGKTFENLVRCGECVLNFPSDNLWTAVEKLASLTGKFPVPLDKQAQFRYEKDKFTAAGLSPAPSELVAVPRVAECPLQMEGRVRNIQPIGEADDGIAAVEVEILKVHAHADILQGSDHIAPQMWRPLIYNFRHYFGLGQELGKTFRAEM
ncbi:MAG: flavin reductase family protein [Anaerolineales bacterium]|nr:flavin reductase family protein [Anaerolineales bacterium]